jgi:hypothetical protein
MLLPSQSTGSDAPQGHSFGTIMVNANGTARFAGTMADGTRATVSAPVSKHGTWPMAAMLYTGSGSLISWLTFTNDAVKLSDIQGAVSWIKPSLSNSKLYPSGFTIETEAMGSVYKKPASAQSPVLTFSQGVLDVVGGNYGAENTFDVTLQGTKGFSADNTVKLGFASANGLLRGTIPDPLTGKSLKISGVAFQKQDMAAGMVLGATQSGSVVLSAPAP